MHYGTDVRQTDYMMGRVFHTLRNGYLSATTGFFAAVDRVVQFMVRKRGWRPVCPDRVNEHDGDISIGSKQTIIFLRSFVIWWDFVARFLAISVLC